MLVENLKLSSDDDIRKNFYFSPSRADGCGRAMYFAYKNVEKTNTVNTHIFEDGRMHESLTINFLRKADIIITDEQKPVDIQTSLKLTPEFCPVCNKKIGKSILHGHIDGIFKKVEDGRTIEGLFEHKSVNNETFKKYLAKGVLFGYLAQSSLYMRGLKLEKGIILVKNKDNSTYFESELNYDLQSDTLTLVKQKDSFGNQTDFNLSYENITQKVIDDFAYIEAEILNDRLPPKKVDFCFNCGYYDLCEEIDNLNTIDNINYDELNNDTKKKYRDTLLKYLEYQQTKKYIEDNLEIIKSDLITLFKENNIKKISFNNIPVSCKSIEKTTLLLDEDKLREKLGNEFNNYIKAYNKTNYEQIYIHFSHKDKLYNFLQKELEKEKHPITNKKKISNFKRKN